MCLLRILGIMLSIAKRYKTMPTTYSPFSLTRPYLPYCTYAHPNRITLHCIAEP